MLYPNKTGSLFRFLLPDCIWKVRTNKKEIFLTFDDGPIPEVTEWVLNILDQFNIKATFFCVGDNIRKHPDIFEKILQSGHSIGNHTFNHIKGWKNKNQDYFNNINNWEEIVNNIGIKLKNKPLFRPPYGQIKFSQAKYLSSNYEIIMWDIITGDFDKSLNKAKCLQKCIEKTESGSVIVFHDSIKAKENLQFILPEYIIEMIKKGYTFSNWN